MWKSYLKTLGFCLLVVGLTHCQPISEGRVIPSTPTNSQSNAPAGNGEIYVIANARTAAVVRSERSLKTLVSCLGTGYPSPLAKQTWEENKGSLSVEGSANSITPPMLVAMAKISAEVCNDLIQQERILSAEQRRIFPMIDFATGPATVTRTAIEDSVHRLARSCWGRPASVTELETIATSVTTAFAIAGNKSDQTITEMIYLCTSVASSFATFEM